MYTPVRRYEILTGKFMVDLRKGVCLCHAHLQPDPVLNRLRIIRKSCQVTCVLAVTAGNIKLIEQILQIPNG